MASRLFVRAGLASAVALGGCHLLGGADDLDFDIPPGPSGPAGPGGGSVGGGSVGGGSVGGGGEGGGVGGCAACDPECGTCQDEICTPVGVSTECAGGLCDGAGTCATGERLWSRRFGSSGQDDVFATAVDGGRLWMAGEFRGANIAFPGEELSSFPKGQGQSAAFLTQIDPANGDALAATTIAGDAANALVSVTSVSAANDRAFLGGYHFVGAINFAGVTSPKDWGGYVAAVTVDGANEMEPSWLLSLESATGAGNARVYGVAASPIDNQVVLVGEIADDVTLHTSTPHTLEPLTATDLAGFVAVVTQNGSGTPSHVWSFPLELALATAATPASRVTAAAHDPIGDLWIAGHFTGGTWNAGNGGSLFSLGNATGQRGFVAKFASGADPNVTCFQPFLGGGTPIHEVHGVAAASDGVAVVGSFTGTIQLTPQSGTTMTNTSGLRDLFVAKLTHCDTLAWQVHIEGAWVDETPPSVTIDAAGNVVVAGTFSAPIMIGNTTLEPQGMDVFVAKFAGSDGSLLWHDVASSPGPERAHAIAALTSGRLLVGGGTENAIFGSMEPAQGSRDGFVSLFEP